MPTKARLLKYIEKDPVLDPVIYLQHSNPLSSKLSFRFTSGLDEITTLNTVHDLT